MILKFSFQRNRWCIAPIAFAVLNTLQFAWGDALFSPTVASKPPVLDKMAVLLRYKKPVNIVAFGDSISEVGRTPNWSGGASNAEANWAQQLGQMLRRAYPQSAITVINSGIGGQNSYEGLGRLDALAELKPDLVLVEFGTNDTCYHYLEPEETKLALKTMAQWIKERYGADVLLVGMGGDNPLAPFCRHVDETVKATREAAVDSGVLYVDMRTPVLAATDNGRLWAQFHMAKNNLHPNDAGHRLWAATIFETIQEHLKEIPH